jgi:adenylylsulfate kinase-like enzyme
MSRASPAEELESESIGIIRLSGSGKSTIANVLEKRLHAEGKHTYVLDGDMFATGSIAIWASPKPTGSKTFAV